jgi:hypothetical protein
VRPYVDRGRCAANSTSTVRRLNLTLYDRTILSAARERFGAVLPSARSHGERRGFGRRGRRSAAEARLSLGRRQELIDSSVIVLAVVLVIIFVIALGWLTLVSKNK